ncbi:FAD-dependent oxidoreductase [Brevundimonas lenta]|uniref:Pyruvate/2-oxoglutarate dehydrogenase complex dihydrolipoamide dehydrogenase (E3) component n=1 Tax=Brevundimonas lenta TaxID=424796 RepID=A0A7W6JBA6_9CAUL|nr:pyruvate/2-oxoglutarate dehydrogenase complex dihydrolipoamide dehydrogenase (E3) component [Brevundimonas lenta]
MSAVSSDVLVIGGGPAGVIAAARAGDLGARTTLVTAGSFGGMAATDGPVPVRTLAHAARLMREARQLERFGVTVSPPVLDYPRLLARVDAVVEEVARTSLLRKQIEDAGVAIHTDVGPVRFLDPHTVEAPDGRRFEADKIILCVGGVSRRLPIPGFELTATHSDAWSLTSVPETLIVVGSGATGAQVASVFNAFGSKVQLFEAGARILHTEEPEVSTCVAEAFRASGITIHEGFGAIESFEPAPGGVRMTWSKDGERHHADAAVVVVAIGWAADTAAMNLATAGVEINERGFIRVDDAQRTTAPHIFAAGDVTGRLMLAPQAQHGGFTAATNAVTGSGESAARAVNPLGSFTDPEYAQVGLGEAAARRAHEVEVFTVGFDVTIRAIIDDRTTGFCKLVVDHADHRVLGCHIVGERAVELAQIAAVVIDAGMTVETLAQLPISFPTYAGILGRAAAAAALGLR